MKQDEMPDKTTQKLFIRGLPFKSLSKHLFFNTTMPDTTRSDKIV